jgi:putative hydrolase of the HAD superfamily
MKEGERSMLEMIAFDADDTLWHNEVHYRDTQAQFLQILSPWAEPERVNAVLNEIEMGNLALYGYGVKAFTLSMLETAVKVSDGGIEGEAVGQILALGRDMLQQEVTLLPGVEETLNILSKDYPLMVITKGDILDQTNKVKRSGLEQYFRRVEVVGDKTTLTYQEVLSKNRISPATFLMVGNSIRSDILPVLALGGRAVHIPADTTWEHEMVSDFDDSQDGFYTLNTMKELPKLLSRLG